MKYIHNGGKEDVLYKKAYAVASEDSMERIPDPLEGPTDGLEAYGYQKDPKDKNHYIEQPLNSLLNHHAKFSSLDNIQLSNGCFGY